MIAIMDETFFWDRWDTMRAARIIQILEENDRLNLIEKDVRWHFDINVIDWVWLELWCGRISGKQTSSISSG